MLSWTEVIQHKDAQLPIKRQRIAKIGSDARYLISDNSHKMLNFISNDYLGLCYAPAIRDAWYKATYTYGIGSTGAPSLSGYSIEHKLLTEELASWLNFDKCLLFSSGYQLNISVISELVDSNTHIYLDKNCHASQVDGVLLSRAKFSRFSAIDLTKIKENIKAGCDSKLHIIVTEGTFSMDGTSIYIKELIEIKRMFPDNVLLIIDDAHGIGALGFNGYGTLEQLGLSLADIDLLIGTFAKAFGVHGGFICGNAKIINYLQHSVRSQIFSTNLSPATAAAIRSSLAIINSAQGRELRTDLANNIAYFKATIKNAGLTLMNQESNHSPIQLIVSDNQGYIVKTHQHLLEHNFLVAKMLYPTVAKATPRLRISLNAGHTVSDINQLVGKLALCQ